MAVILYASYMLAMPLYQMNFINRIKHLTSIGTDARLAFKKHISPPDYAALLNLIDERGHRGDAAEQRVRLHI